MPLFVVSACLFSNPTTALGAAANVVRQVTEGNQAYADGEYEQALDAYKLADIDLPESPEITYNRALAYYRLRDFSKARELFNQALSTRDLDLEARIKFNLGNVAYSQALEKLSDLEEAITSARRAIDHYRDALDLNPDDDDARANIETAQLLIKDLLDKQKQQQEQQQDQQQCDNPQENQDNQDQQQEQQQDQQQDQQQQQQGEQDQQQQDQQQPGQQDQQQDAQEEQQQAQPQEVRELTEQEAERLLQAVRDKEAKRREELARRERAKRVPVRRDW